YLPDHGAGAVVAPAWVDQALGRRAAGVGMKRLAAGFWPVVALVAWLLPDSLPILTQMLIMGLFAVSLDLALGVAGILTIGHAAFFGMGAYVAGLLAVHGWSEPLSGLLIAAMVCACM